MKRPKPGTLVLVRWRDSCFLPSRWHGSREVRRHKPSEMTSVGWVAKATRRRLVLYASMAHGEIGEPWSDVTAIPWGCVTKVRRLR